MLREYFGEILCQSPERSGLPSGARGAGADRFGLPSGVRGIPAVGWFNHWAASGSAQRDRYDGDESGLHAATVRRSWPRPLNTASIAACAHFSPSAPDTPIAPMTWPLSTMGAPPAEGNRP